jgi:succinate dehydrogenase / fumarate reductase flavoprotein subunit
MDFRDAITQRGEREIQNRYGNLFELYEQITGEDPWSVPMQIYPAPHYTMGGLWVDYNLQTTVPGLFAIGESNFSDHGANRLGASAMMQCLADGYFVVPHTVTDYLARLDARGLDPGHEAFGQTQSAVQQRLEQLLAVDGKTPTRHVHRELGKLMLDVCGVSRVGPKLERALQEIPAIRERFWSEVKVGGDAMSLNQGLEYAGRVADFLELAELMCRDALARDESCGCHLREEHKTEDGEPVRDDDRFAHAAVWEYQGRDETPERHVEPLEFNELQPKQRSYA